MKSIYAVIFTLFTVLGYSQSDTLALKNGEKLVVKITSTKGQEIVYQNFGFGENVTFSIDKEKVSYLVRASYGEREYIKNKGNKKTKKTKSSSLAKSSKEPKKAKAPKEKKTWKLFTPKEATVNSEPGNQETAKVEKVEEKQETVKPSEKEEPKTKEEAVNQEETAKSKPVKTPKAEKKETKPSKDEKGRPRFFYPHKVPGNKLQYNLVNLGTGILELTYERVFSQHFGLELTYGTKSTNDIELRNYGLGFKLYNKSKGQGRTGNTYFKPELFYLTYVKTDDGVTQEEGGILGGGTTSTYSATYEQQIAGLALHIGRKWDFTPRFQFEIFLGIGAGYLIESYDSDNPNSEPNYGSQDDIRGSKFVYTEGFRNEELPVVPTASGGVKFGFSF
ncbi:hypothetical protein [Luteibaculum oceani]|uniref:DUF3575 domain-containing protein n=1 Tax=Luteibaculum oceani TaxID=1294296 RepID=A0A5C6US19_9FLAO|nr:hypothetical protein [Luteibaculum oceani]TXC76122.1 hypothetical protein FRX97_11460 [Luteibaculum oceani]